MDPMADALYGIYGELASLKLALTILVMVLTHIAAYNIGHYRGSK